MDRIEPVLQERGNTHGDFAVNSEISQSLKDIVYSAPKHCELNDYQKEALDMIMHKTARILCGDPHYDDHWVDIAGYATLVSKVLSRGG